jgi:uncharacterized protein YheU (UPF0270 family)
MAQFVAIPPARLQAQTLQALLEEFASRDGTDYGWREQSLDEKVAQLRRGLEGGALTLLYDSESEHWDLLEHEQAARLLEGDAP